jgi:hypothetical protein
VATDFGTDLSCWPDLDGSGALVSGYIQLGQALCRRLTCPRGGLLYDPGYGTDIRGYLGETLAATTTSSLIQSAIEREVTQDERVFAAQAQVTIVPAANMLVAHLTVQTADGPFNYVLAVTALSVTLLKAG